MARTYTIAAFTENSPGVLHRITILFTRRKINIESLTVSETETHGISRFTIVVKTEEDLIKKVAKQINRIIEVVDVFVAENRDLIAREIGLIKVASSPAKRTEIEDLVSRHGGTVSLLHEDYVIVEATGEEDDIQSLYLLLEPYGIIEFLRSGRVAVLKENREDKQIFLNSHE